LLLLATGPSTPDAVELIESPRAYELTSLLASLADMVIVASPSPLEVADTQIIAQWMDAAVVVVSCDTTTQTNLTRTRDALTQTGVCVLGLVLIKPNGKKRSFSQATPQHSLRTAKDGAPALASRTDSSS
jgi:Mrp family chromosome partitioning ATPase